jgi:hypothetical protein
VISPLHRDVGEKGIFIYALTNLYKPDEQLPFARRENLYSPRNFRASLSYVPA